MDANPYQSPSDISQVGDVTNVSAAGLWRDGAHLVLDLHGSQFPLRCVKSNEPVSSLTPNRIEWITLPLPVKILIFVLFAAVGLLFTKFLRGRSTEVGLGLSDAYQRKRRQLIRFGWCFVLVGIVGLILFTFVYVAAMVSGVPDSTGEMLMFIPLVLSTVAIGGVVTLVFAYTPVLRVKKWKNDQIWLSGANPEFLNALPQWASY